MVVLYGVPKNLPPTERGILSLNLFLKKKSSPEKKETLRKPSGFFSFFSDEFVLVQFGGSHSCPLLCYLKADNMSFF